MTSSNRSQFLLLTALEYSRVMSACAALEGALAGSDSATREYELEVSLAVVELKEALSVTDRNRGKLDDVVAALDQAAADRTQAASD